MANHESIKILRTGDSGVNSENYNTTLLKGQPFYNKQKNYLTIGHEENGTVQQKPITVREVVGYFDDIECNVPEGASQGTISSQSKISNSTNDEYHIKSIITKDISGNTLDQKLSLYSSKNFEIESNNNLNLNSNNNLNLKSKGFKIESTSFKLTRTRTEGGDDNYNNYMDLDLRQVNNGYNKDTPLWMGQVFGNTDADVKESFPAYSNIEDLNYNPNSKKLTSNSIGVSKNVTLQYDDKLNALKFVFNNL